MPLQKRVGILGIGMVTAGGKNVDETWQSLMVGTDTSSLRRCPDGVNRSCATISSYGDNIYTYALGAIGEACQGHSVIPDAVCVGSSSDTVAMREAQVTGFDPYAGAFLVDKLAGLYDLKTKVQAANACAASSHAIAIAMDLIRSGQSQVAIAGGADEVTFSSISGFSAWRVYGERCRPFAADRHGLILADGAAFMVLAPDGVGTPLAYLTGAGLASDAGSISGMEKEAVRRVMGDSMNEAGLWMDVDAIIAHGTGTQLNDEVESEAIAGFGPWEDQCLPHVLSYKGVLGHPQGASGAIGVVLAVKAILESELWGTIPQAQVDPELGVATAVTVQPFKTPLKNVMVLSHGSWGVYSSLIVSAVR